ncbi:hypothetical protein GUITHDRAFT_139066 [Guillardia theta CCMP2712]|uniref:Uncharacterized protein n=1 Tax=Guillardia theta (strain CCMP2712) TaxID=905079 RepID=L1JB17_GUITC|nr:hypothetical protein GUITHDRAFT_139066 [Guillardia theta CCMP2712]EKX45517.1 hypothetical protein GUITHDRAFT_139066 [Guillardia theta CCMP2712]|eukprot:XP_005832497.1 hypothetical protein GUITHDRAFT_139066 [Guillardia theta CCMP2712]
MAIKAQSELSGVMNIEIRRGIESKEMQNDQGQEGYGSTSMRQGDHVIYVSIGDAQGRRRHFGENRMGKAVLGGLALVLCACLLVSSAMEERKYVPFSSVLAVWKEQMANIKKLEMQLAAKEVKKDMVNKASMHLRAADKAIAFQLAAQPVTSKLAVDCAKKDSYDILKNAFTGLATNISAENATLFAKDQELYAAATEAKEKWLTAESKFRSAESDHKSAKEAAAYARSKYDFYESAVTQGQNEYDAVKPQLDSEKSQLSAELPILQQIKALISSMNGASTKAAPTSLMQVGNLKSLILSLSPPSRNKKIAKQITHVRTVLAETNTVGTMASMLSVIDGIVSHIETRVTEINNDVARMESDLNDNKGKRESWQEKVVDLSDAADKAENKMNSAGLVRQQLGGDHLVKQQDYEDNHATFLDEAEKLTRQSTAIAVILKKINDAISQCG